MFDQDRVKLKPKQKIEVDGADTGWLWRKRKSDFQMLDENSVHRISHPDRKIFRLKVLDFHNGCGEFG